jgi:hypothetical protein
MTLAGRDQTSPSPLSAIIWPGWRAETGAKLVQRVGRGIRLTPEGEHLARRTAASRMCSADVTPNELSASFSRWLRCIDSLWARSMSMSPKR